MPDPTAQAVRNLVLLQRLSNGLAKTSGDQLDELVAEIVALLIRLDPTSVQPRYRRGRLDKLIARAEQLIATQFRPIRIGLTESVVQVGVDQARRASDALPGDTSVSRLSSQVRQVVRAEPMHGVALREWIDRAEAAMAANLAQQMRLGVIAGESLPELRKRLAGVRRTALNHLRGVSRTATTAIAAHGHMVAYRQNDDVVESVEFVATLDQRTTIICAKWDGTVWPVDSPDIQVPPLHFRCRSSLAPVVNYDALGLRPPREGQRASADGPVKASVRYRDYFRGLSAGDQDRIIGATRGRLFRSGQLTFDQMVAADNTIVPVSRLAA